MVDVRHWEDDGLKGKKGSAADSTLAAGSKAASVASYVMVGKILTLIMAGLALVLVTRFLGPTQYGIYTLAIAFGSIFGSLGYFGIGIALNKFISEYKQAGKKDEINAAVSNSLFLVVGSGLLLGVLGFLFSGIISQYIFHTTSMYYIIQLVVVEIVMIMFFGVFYDALVGYGSGKHVAIVAGVQALLQASVSIILAYEGLGAIAPIIGLVVGYFVGFFVGIYLIFRYNKFSFVRPSMKFMRKILSFSAPLAVSGIISNFAGSAALIFLGYFVLPSVIGNIGLTSKTSSLVGIVFDSISLALLPAFSAALANKKLNKDIGKLYDYSVYLAVILVGPLLFYVASFSGPFTQFIFGNNYNLAPLYIPFMSIGLLIGVAGSYANTLLISANKVKMVAKYNVLVNAIVLALVLVAVPLFGSLGYVTITFLIAPIIVDIFFIWKLSKMFRLSVKTNKLARLIVADVIVSAVAIPLYFVFNGIILLVVAAALFIILYPLISVLLGGADKADISTIRVLSKEIPLVGKIFAAFMDYASLVAR